MNIEDIIEIANQTEEAASLRDTVEHSVKHYLDEMRGADIQQMYDMVLSEIEEPLLQVVMGHVKQNQSSAARMLGLSRGTLRKKLERYGMLISGSTKSKMPEEIA
jgi:Fis family transcriptional regulator, factor for inversion stimulation protein